MRTKPPHTRRVFMQQRRGRMTAWSPLEDQCSRGAGDLDREPQFTLRPALT